MSCFAKSGAKGWHGMRLSGRKQKEVQAGGHGGCDGGAHHHSCAGVHSPGPRWRFTNTGTAVVASRSSTVTRRWMPAGVGAAEWWDGMLYVPPNTQVPTLKIVRGRSSRFGSGAKERGQQHR